MSFFVEIDSWCKARVTVSDCIGADDSVFNKILIKVDEVDILNNMISVYMTIRKDLIYKAILRSWRL